MSDRVDRIRVVFSDLDGTLFTPTSEGHTITERTARTIRRMQEVKKVKFVVSTGRPYPDVFANLGDYGAEPDYYITSNGARIHDKDKNCVFSVNMHPGVALDLLQLPCTPNPDGSIDLDGLGAQARRRPRSFVANVNCEDEWFTDKTLPEVRAVFHSQFKYQQVDPAAMTEEKLTGTHSMWMRGDTESLSCVDAYVRRRYPGIAQSKFALPHVLDVFPNSVSKGEAARRVCQDMLGLPLEAAAAFGDGWNDETMLAAVGHPFLLGNAPQDLKEALPHVEVIGTNSSKEDGVAAKLEEIFFS